MSRPLDLLVDALAAWRITHLVIADAFPPVDRARQKVMTWFGPDSSVTYLVQCPYCVGVYAGAAVAAARMLAPRAWRQAGWALAVAAAVPFIEALDERAAG